MNPKINPQPMKSKKRLGNPNPNCVLTSKTYL
jgi:hypothetical protein